MAAVSCPRRKLVKSGKPTLRPGFLIFSVYIRHLHFLRSAINRCATIKKWFNDTNIASAVAVLLTINPQCRITGINM